MSKPRLQIRPHQLREARLRLVLTRDQVAEKSGVSAHRIAQLEAGTILGVKPDTVNALAEALGVEPTAISIVAWEKVS